MAVTPSYRNFVIEQLEHFASIASKSMFGGVGLYADDYFFALIAEDHLYFKVDDTNRSDFEAAQMEPFRPYGDDRAMKYYEVPVEVLEDVDALKEWADKAIEVARRARSGKRRK
jgi:DNA transformation protein